MGLLSNAHLQPCNTDWAVVYVSGPKETQNKWLTVVPPSIAKPMLASQLSQHHEYLIQNSTSSQLFVPLTLP